MDRFIFPLIGKLINLLVPEIIKYLVIQLYLKIIRPLFCQMIDLVDRAVVSSRRLDRMLGYSVLAFMMVILATQLWNKGDLCKDLWVRNMFRVEAVVLLILSVVGYYFAWILGPSWHPLRKKMRGV